MTTIINSDAGPASQCERLSRRAVHHISQAPHPGYGCSVTERHVQSRSGGASADWSRVTCAACLAQRAGLVRDASAVADATVAASSADERADASAAMVEVATRHPMPAALARVHRLASRLTPEQRIAARRTQRWQDIYETLVPR